MATERIRGAFTDASTIPLAHGGTEDRAAEGTPPSDRIACSLRQRKLPENIENTRFFDDFVVSYNNILIQKILFRCWEVGV